MLAILFALLAMAPPTDDDQVSSALSVEVRLNADREVPVAEVVARVAEKTHVEVAPPSSAISLPVAGVSGALCRRLLKDCLGPDFDVGIKADSIVLTFPARLAERPGRAEVKDRLRLLSERAEQAARDRQSFGMKALKSYRPNDPGRPTVCLVHGLNSNSGGFVHMIRPLEEAGYGIVVFDYPFNRPIDESCDRFRRDWDTFRRNSGETRPWAILAHSMGCLVARSLIETGDEDAVRRDVSSLIMIAPVNQGSHVARLQNAIQVISGIRAINDKEKARAFAVLSDGVGRAAEDLLPGSRFLEDLNRNERNPRVAYHILAGDSGFVTRDGRRQIEARTEEVTRAAGFLGGLARAAMRDLPSLLDEISDGTGDGCVSVEGTRLDGAPDHRTIHANHAELIRAPILFPDPGPVACMPHVLNWLKKDMATGPRSPR